jgi:hypothetical protein
VRVGQRGIFSISKEKTHAGVKVYSVLHGKAGQKGKKELLGRASMRMCLPFM